MDYSAVVEALYERHRSVRDAGFSGDAYKPGLDAMLSYAEFLGHPERQFRTVHVAGTNGKGSVCSMLAAALAARGLRVGLYTSPHLVDFRERIKIIAAPVAAAAERPLCHPEEAAVLCHPEEAAVLCHPEEAQADEGSLMAGSFPSATMISREDVCDFLERYDREGLTFFEVTTGMAFWWFAEQKVDVAVIETGLGGRLDSTNIITPELSVITSIGLDHCDLLGSTRAGIAAEKAGIFKPGVPALVWGRDSETQPVFESIAAQVGAPIFFAEDFPAALAFASQGEPPETTVSLHLDLTGPCQDLNLRTVLAALTLLPQLQSQIVDSQVINDSAFGQNTEGKTNNPRIINDLALQSPLSEAELAAISHAARITGLRGRWEQLLADPLTICDIGHNPPALAANFARLEQLRREVNGGAFSCTSQAENGKFLSKTCREVNGGAFSYTSRTENGIEPSEILRSCASLRRPLLVVYGAMRDKDVDDIKHYLPQDAEYFLVQPQTARAMPLEELALKLKSFNCTVAGSVKQGVQQALERAKQLPGAIVYIGGSTYVVSEAIMYLESI